jgi:hypothetical protein
MAFAQFVVAVCLLFPCDIDGSSEEQHLAGRIDGLHIRLLTQTCSMFLVLL